MHKKNISRQAGNCVCESYRNEIEASNTGIKFGKNTFRNSARLHSLPYTRLHTYLTTIRGKPELSAFLYNLCFIYIYIYIVECFLNILRRRFKKKVDISINTGNSLHVSVPFSIVIHQYRNRNTKMLLQRCNNRKRRKTSTTQVYIQSFVWNLIYTTISVPGLSVIVRTEPCQLKKNGNVGMCLTGAIETRYLPQRQIFC